MSSTKGERDYYDCKECGGSYRPDEMFVASAHGREYACRGCVAQYLVDGEWPHTEQ